MGLLNRTTTAMTHYDIQQRRRKAIVEEGREHQRFIVRKKDVELVPTARGVRTGVYMGRDGDRPTRIIDALVHEVDPGVLSTIHRHSWDAVMLIVEGHGWTEVNGARYEYKPWDTVYLPAWAWHRQGNDGNKTARFMTFSTEPTMEVVGGAMIEDAGHTPYAQLPEQSSATGPRGDDPYARRLRRLDDYWKENRTGRIHVRYEDLTLLVNPKGTRSTFMLDAFLGHKTSGLTLAMNQMAPGKWQKKHRHGGEAWLYALEGRGHSVIDGKRYDWEEGDLVVVDHWAWHQHHNSDPDMTARLIRVHNFAGIYDAMRCLLDPMTLEEEEPNSEPDVSTVTWPPDRRPD
ncbi:MAG TPA: cupin domain-containing protein [Candidatus Binatia bacterium]|nr:cupin domain-containing protein [Candidatus Binatia bacterium]